MNLKLDAKLHKNRPVGITGIRFTDVSGESEDSIGAWSRCGRGGGCPLPACCFCHYGAMRAVVQKSPDKDSSSVFRQEDICSTALRNVPCCGKRGAVDRCLRRDYCIILSACPTQ